MTQSFLDGRVVVVVGDITRQDVIAGIEAIALGQKARKDSQAACRRGPDGRKATLVFL